uniref:C2 NT-type domain-containing protein n=1 Tax=Schistosoma mansoni TaxID=6183 RepID=A0A3Q0KI13_SCHMA
MDMACVPLFNKQQCYNFEVLVKLHSLTAVPYVNSVTFAKLRLLNGRSSAQYSPRTEIRNNIVTWNSEHRFHCKFKSNAETSILDPNILKVSIRMETKGGKSFHKVGFVSINLSCFAAVGNVINRRRYILEGYDEKRKRQDNSLLSISFCLRQLTGDNCFRTPKEDLSNCLIEPPDFIELPETDSETREYSMTDCSLMNSVHNTTTTTNINNNSVTNQNSNDLNILKPVDNSISKLTNNPLDILHSLNLNTVPSSCVLSTSPSSSSSLPTETVSSTTPAPLPSIADRSSEKINYSTSFSHLKMPSWDNSSVYPAGSSSCVSKSSICQNELTSSQTNVNQSSNAFKQADQSQSFYCDISDSSSVTPISNSTSSTPCSMSKGSLLLRSPLTLPLDKSIPSGRVNPQQQNLIIDASAVVELDKQLSNVTHDKPRFGQNVTFNILNPDNVTCYSLPNRHHLPNLCMTTDTPSDENRQNANIIGTDPSVKYCNYGKKSYDYFATDSVLLVRSSRRRRIRPDLQVLPSMNTDLKNTDPSSPNSTSATADPSTSKSNPSDCLRPENDSSLSSISSSTATASTATVGVSQIMSKSGIPMDYYYSSGYQSHSRQSSLESQPVGSSPPSLSAEVCTQTQ